MQEWRTYVLIFGKDLVDVGEIIALGNWVMVQSNMARHL
jgi:hypothetical protein